MKRFSALFTAVDGTTSTSAKVQHLAAYLGTGEEQDRLWCLALFSGRRPKRAVSTTKLAEWAQEAADISPWLFEEAYAVAGDLAETIALLLPAPTGTLTLSLTEAIGEVAQLAQLEEPARKARILALWAELPEDQRLVFNKLLTGGFRLGVSRKLMTRALAKATGGDEAGWAHRLMGQWTPQTITWADLLAQDGAGDLSRPYPFALAYGLEGAPKDLGPREEWQAEWKWDGIRGQLVIRGGESHLWSRGEELLTDRFPEFRTVAHHLPSGTVLDGEVVAWDGTRPLPFAKLQTRIARKTLTKKVLADAPAAFLAYDLLEAGGTDLRATTLAHRRHHLEALLSAVPEDLPLFAAPILGRDIWPEWADLAAARAEARAYQAEGLMLKRVSSPYFIGRKKGDWWKWKLDPLTIDAVMIYAQAGHGRRANLFTDFTFAVRDGNTLVPFAKAYSGLTDDEFREITAWVRKHTVQRFGPVRQVPGDLVFELAFEGVQSSPRHKSGVALRFPRILRWRRDKTADQADSLAHLHALLAQYG